MFTGCQKSTQIELKNEFDSEFSLLYNDVQIKGDLLSDSNGIVIKVNSPKALAGLEIQAKEDIYNASFNGINISYSKEDLPDGVFFKMIVISLSQLMNSQELEFQREEDEYFATDSCDLGEIKITADKSCFVKKIEIANQNFHLNLKQKELSN